MFPQLNTIPAVAPQNLSNLARMALEIESDMDQGDTKGAIRLCSQQAINGIGWAFLASTMLAHANYGASRRAML